jgi:hypothetical protein
MSNKVTIKPNTNRLKQLIKDHGKTWSIVKGPKGMQCFNGQLGMAIQSLDGKHERNIPMTSVSTTTL